MPLAAGTHLGAYEVTSQLGVGGMGEVYRATDTKLGRDIAIKTLPSALAQDPDRLARFEREAKLLASLNHAHIGAIYGLDEHEGTQFIAMELVEGETLEEKLKDGALPLDDSLQIALQIAEALEAAHEKGVVHRDLKPANIMLTRDGVVKVLDFGLAKAFAGDPNQASPAHSPALSMAMTQQGLILGTAGYMSPEQASGQATDQRADIWAFGVVLYEMLTGLPLFSGESVPHILADVLRTEPDWNRLPEDLHPRLKLLLERCLRKKVHDRYHSIADARVDIEEILRHPHVYTATPDTTARPVQPMWRRVLPTTALVAVAVVITAFAVWVGTRPEPSPVNRFDYELPENQTLANSNYTALTIAPDGRSFVYGTQNGLYLRAMDTLDARVISGTAGIPAALPEFSPDGETVAYFSPGQLNRVAITGGAPVDISRANQPFGMSWATDDTIFYGHPAGIYRVAASGGSAETIIPADPGTIVYGPRLLPGGDSLLFTEYPTGSVGTGRIVAQSLATQERTVLLDGADARYLPTGHLVYALDSNLLAVAFDPGTLTLLNGPVPVVQGVMRDTLSGGANFDVSNNGTLVYFHGEARTGLNALVLVDRAGREESIGAPPRNYNYPRVSPDGQRVALDVRDQEHDVWIWDLSREALTRLTFDSGEDEFPTWSLDSRQIVFSSTRDSGSSFTTTLYAKAADGTGTVELLAKSAGQLFPTAFVPEAAELLVYGAVESDINDNIASISLADGESLPLLSSTFTEATPELSPDGRWLAYMSNESGREEIYVRPFPDVEGGRWQVSTNGGTQPLWARDGRELFYRDGRAIMVVPVQTDPSFTVGNPEMLFEGEYVVGPGGRNYDVSPDGERFLMVKPFRGAAQALEIVIVENWFEELKRLVPTD